MRTQAQAIGVVMAILLITALAGCNGGSGGLAGLSASSARHDSLRISAGPNHFTVDKNSRVQRVSVDAARIRGQMLSDAPAAPVEGRTASSATADPAVAGALAELDALPVPPGANPAVFAMLKASFKRMLLAPGFKTASVPPDTAPSKVNDLQATGDTTSATFTFTYRNSGDYNQDSLVAIQDLTQLGTHWGKDNTSPDWNVAQVADGNGNGRVDLPDLMPIGANFGKKVDGYHLQYSTDGATGWGQVADIPWGESAVPGGGGFRTFTHVLAPATAGFYRVLPYDTSGEGIASDPYQFPSGGNNPPVASLSADPSSGDPPLDVDLDGGASSDPDAGDSIVKYEFDYGEGGGYQDFGAVSITTHTYATVGIYTAKLRVTDEGGLTDEDQKTITVGVAGNLFDQALTGIGKARTDLNLGTFPDQIDFTGFTNYGNDLAPFDDDNDPLTDPVGVPGSRFGAYTDYWHNDHSHVPTWASAFTDAASDATSIEALVKSADDKFFEGDNRQAFFAGGPVAGTDYTPAATDPLATAVIDLITNNGGTPDGTAITADAADVPAELQDALAMVLQAADAEGKAIQDYKTFFLGAYDPGEPPETNIWQHAYNYSYAMRVPVGTVSNWSFRLFGLDTTDFTTFTATVRPYACVINYTIFAQAAIDLAHALDQANAVLSGGGITGTFSFDQITPIGRILINSGDGATTYAQTASETDPSGYYLLICDVDGNDTYNCCAGASGNMFNPVSINLDLSGDDTYAALDDYTDANGLNDDFASQQGAGRWGVGILMDYAGSDHYNTSQAGQGTGIVGWGLLYDAGGDDHFFGVNHVQGSGMCGVGILYDGGGMDDYHSWAYAQGFGDIWGLGMLLDKGAETDNYFAEWDATVAPTTFASPQNAAINASFCQGAAFGLRTTATYPVVLDGGVGALIDGGGDDTYTCGVFGQAVGFWFATGVLDDRAGNDAYDGDWYVQGSTAHYATSILMDRQGNDTHNAAYATRGFPLENCATCGAHDHSVSWLLDGAGDDQYFVSGLALGCGNVNGWGYFCDMGAGVDAYHIPNDPNYNLTTLGRGHLSGEVPEGDGRETEITFGLFVDCGGADTYDASYASIPSGSIGNVAAGNDLGWYRFGYDQDFANDFRLSELGTGQDGSGVTGFEFP